MKPKIWRLSGVAETDSHQNDKDSVFESESKILAPTAESTDAGADIAATFATATLQPESATEAKADIMTKPLITDKADDLLLPEAPAKQHSFIPPAAAKMPGEEPVPTTSKAAATRPSLINKISDLWSHKPENASNAKTTSDLAIKKTDAQAEKTSSILDLPRGDMVQHGNDDSTKASKKPESASCTQGTFENAGDDLDIPAFLRRQAN